MKTVAKTNRTKQPEASEGKVATAGQNANAANAKKKRPQPTRRSKQLSPREQFENDKRSLQKTLGHNRDGGRVEQWERDKRAVFQALGHDVDGKCPAGVDWEAHYKNRENLSKVPIENEAANRAANLRASSWITFHSAKVAREARRGCGPWSCGWWFCGKNLKADQWADLRTAIKILKESGRDPNGWELAYRASAYAENVRLAKKWPQVKDLWAFYGKNPNLLPDTIEVQWEWCNGEWKHDPKDRDALLEKLQAVLFARHPQGVGKPVDAPYHHFLNDHPVKSWESFPEGGVSSTWAPKVAAALLVLFGTVKEGSSLKKETHRAAEAWDLGRELNHRMKPKIR